MKAGPELDNLVAEKVMGREKPPRYGIDTVKISSSDIFPPKTPPYSTDLSAAWEVMEFLRGYMNRRCDDGSQVCIELIYLNEVPPWTCQGFYYRNGDRWDFAEVGDTAPLAICLTALKAVGVEV